jgi:hypothetical protein
MKVTRFLIAVLVAALAGCTSTDSATTKTSRPTAARPAAQPDRKEYAGAAEAKGNTFLTARNKAVMSAVQKAVVDMLGADTESANRKKLDEVLYTAPNPNVYIYPDSLKQVRRETRGEDNWYYELTVQVNLVAVRNTLSANGLLGGSGAQAAGGAREVAKTEGAAGGAAGALGATAAPGTTGGAAATPAIIAPGLTPEERAFIARYVDRMTYMVYYADDSKEEPQYRKSAVGKANEYLASLTLDTIDADQVEKLKEDQRTAFEAQQGQSQSIIQFIAQRLNADVYIEISGRSAGSTQAGKHYGEASIDLKAFEASTGVLMGSASFNTLDKAFSQTSQESARINAIQGAVFRTMPRVLEQVKANMSKSLERGLRYEMIVQKPLGDRQMSRFWERLQRDCKDLKSVSQSAEEVKYYVWFIGTVDDFKKLVYKITDAVPGLENMEMVLTRGKSITFNTNR